MFSLICVWINGWVNNREAGDLRRYRGHYDVIVMYFKDFNYELINCLWNGFQCTINGGCIVHTKAALAGRCPMRDIVNTQFHSCPYFYNYWFYAWNLTMHRQMLIIAATKANLASRSQCKPFHFTYGMAFISILVVAFIVNFVDGDVQLTQYAIEDDYGAHTCTQLLSCGPLTVLTSQKKSECVFRALQIGAGAFVYQESNGSCLLCPQASVGDAPIEVNASLPVHVTSKVITQVSFSGIICLYAPIQWKTTLHRNVVSHWMGSYTKWCPHYSLKLILQSGYCFISFVLTV